MKTLDKTQEAISTWLNKWDAHLASTGYTPLLGGHEPTSVAHLRERDLSSYPAPTADMTDKEKANLAWKRSELEHDNERIRHQKSELIKDHKNRLAHKIIASLRPRAGLRLKKLQTAHLKSGTIDNPDAIYDGIAMYQELMALRSASLSKPKRDEIKKALADFESTKLADGCSEQDFSDKINHFILHINPYLTRKYEGEELGEYIIELLPASRTSDGLALMRELRRDKKLNDPTAVTTACLEIVAAHAKGSKKAITPPVAAITAKEMRRLLAGDPEEMRAALQTRGLTESASPPVLAPGHRYPSTQSCQFQPVQHITNTVFQLTASPLCDW